MKKHTPSVGSQSTRKPTKPKPRPSREFIYSLHGKYRGEGLMKALMEEKKREREL